LERLAKVILYGTLATTSPLYNISALCNAKKKNKYKIFRKAQRAAVWPPLIYAHGKLISCKSSKI